MASQPLIGRALIGLVDNLLQAGMVISVALLSRQAHLEVEGVLSNAGFVWPLRLYRFEQSTRGQLRPRWDAGDVKYLVGDSPQCALPLHKVTATPVGGTHRRDPTVATHATACQAF